MDVGAKMDIYKMLEKLCKEGVAIVLVSTDVPEILSISHRVLVVSTGKIRANVLLTMRLPRCAQLRPL